jgi:Spherulation-specific family 4
MPILAIALTAAVGVGLGAADLAGVWRGDGTGAAAGSGASPAAAAGRAAGARTGTGSRAGTTARTRPVAAGSGVCEQLVPEAYGPTVWPGSEASSPVPANVIANWGQGYGGAGGGPGLARGAARLATIRQAQAQGIDVLGYVWTDYANNAAGHPAGSRMTPAPLFAAENEAMEWYRWYGVKTIFFDGATTGTGKGQLRYYQRLYNYVHAHIPGGQVWINPGWYPVPAYLSAADVIMDFESSYGTLVANPPPAWVHRYPARRFANVLHLPASQAPSLAAALALARADNAGHVYVADQQNYSALPAYWSAENASAAAKCGPAARPAGRAWNGRRSARAAASGAARTAGTGCCRRTG